MKLKNILKKSFFTICLISSIQVVNATTIYVSGNQVRLRTGPGTNHQYIMELNENTALTLLSNEKYSGDGCANGWYNVKVDNKEGYICSTFTKTGIQSASYNRPWTSPKKAIYGGAEFVADGYISAGQNTSYLKKFNVNPNAYYSVYTHQYMANISAPYSEAANAYKSYKENNLLSLPLHFTIPIFNNMPAKTSHPVYGEEQGGTSTIKDQTFEAELNKQGFDETYKRWLRTVHEAHPNWTFSSLRTNLDFNNSIAREKYTSSVYYTCTACREVPYYETESNWYIANNQTVGYFLDPRNFLEEDSILMFEDLSYSDNYTEATVKSVLRGTFMEGNDPIDNEAYSKIFLDAGKAFNVSPIYLASLSKQEVGTQGSFTTTGEQIEYNGITYIGFYNFFNIGAYSSEPNPAKAGIVYASAGASRNSQGVYVGNVGGSPVVPASTNTNNNQGTNNNNNNEPTNTQTETPTPTTTENIESNSTVAQTLKAMNLNQKKSYVTNFKVGTKVSSIANKNITIKDASGKNADNNATISTGYSLNFKSGEKLVVVIYGDLNGDGAINSGDILKMRQQMLGQIKLEGAYLESAHVKSLTGNINSGDLLKLRQQILGQTTIDQS